MGRHNPFTPRGAHKLWKRELKIADRLAARKHGNAGHGSAPVRERLPQTFEVGYLDHYDAPNLAVAVERQYGIRSFYELNRRNPLETFAAQLQGSPRPVIAHSASDAARLEALLRQQGHRVIAPIRRSHETTGLTAPLDYTGHGTDIHFYGRRRPLHRF